MDKVHWNDLTPEQQEAIRERYCNHCVYRGRWMCDPKTFPYYEGKKLCEVAPGNLMFIPE